MVDEYVQRVISGRQYTKSALADIGIKSHGEVGNYLLIDLKSAEICRQVVSFLEENFIYVKGNYHAPWEKYILITVGPKELMEKFVGTMIKAKERFQI